MEPTLYFYPRRGDSFDLSLDGERISIGRSAANDVKLPDPFSSNEHAIISSEEGRLFIQDNESKNGVIVNSIKIRSKTALKTGDEILIGSTRIAVGKELQTRVDITDVTPASKGSKTAFKVTDILGVADSSTAIRKRRRDLIIMEVAKALMLHVEIPRLLDHIMDLITDYIPMDSSVLMLQEGEPLQMFEKVTRTKSGEAQHSRIQISSSIIKEVVERHQSILIPAVPEDTRYGKRDSVIRAKIKSVMCVPLWNGEEILGLVYADRSSIPDQFTKADLRTLTLLANLAAVKIEQAKFYEERKETERIKEGLKRAAEIQRRLLPRRNPEIEHYSIVGTNVPCYQVGGDYYDFIDVDANRLGVIIADVSGKGLGPCLHMTTLRARVHAEIHEAYDIERMAERINDCIHCDTDVNEFISFFYCELNKDTGGLTYINAGHNPPVVFGKNKKFRRLESTGLCLGMFPEQTYSVETTSLNSGDTAVLFTDGIIESRNSDNEEFSEERLLKLIKANLKSSADELKERIITELNAFTSGVPQWDDMTLVIIKRMA